jgi:hypothetical protein
MDINKDQVVFFLARHAKMARALTEFDQEAAAKRGMPYEQRQKMVEAAKDANLESACLDKAMEIVQSHEW